MKNADELAKELGKYFDWDDESEQVHCIAKALTEYAEERVKEGFLYQATIAQKGVKHV